MDKREDIIKQRPKREIIHMTTAILWGQRSTCKRPNRKIGAVITTSDMTQILSIGYNGPCKGLFNDSCRNTEGNCGCLHAEMNAIAKVDSTIPNKVLFITMQPCEMCASLIAQANISMVWYLDSYRNNDGLSILSQCNIRHHQMFKDELYQLAALLQLCTCKSGTINYESQG